MLKIQIRSSFRNKFDEYTNGLVRNSFHKGLKCVRLFTYDFE